MALEHLFQHLPADEREAALSLLRVEMARRRRRALLPLARPIPVVARPALPAEKRCPGCDEVRPLADWGLNRARPDGLQTYCRWCR